MALLNYWAPDGCLNYRWPQLQRGEKTHANDSSGEGVGQEGATRDRQPPLALLRLPWSQRGLCYILSATWPWSALESGPETFPSPLSGSRLLLLQISASKPQVLKKPVLTSLIYPFTTLGISPSKHRPRFTVFLLFQSLSELEIQGSQDLCLFCLRSDPH